MDILITSAEAFPWLDETPLPEREEPVFILRRQSKWDTSAQPKARVADSVDGDDEPQEKRLCLAPRGPLYLQVASQAHLPTYTGIVTGMAP
jgi:hypothetical protein